MSAPFPFVDIASEIAGLRSEIDAAIAGVLNSQRFIGGPEVTAFENELAEYCGAAHAVGVSSGTDALLASLMALDVPSGVEVMTTPFSFFATAGVIARVGAKPVFVDIDPETFNLDAAQAVNHVGNRTAAIMPVHLFGRPAALPETSPVPIIEDAAQSVGACPVRGQLAALSFSTKNLGACGDGGAVLTNDAELAERLRVLRSQGGKPKYYHSVVGGNFRLDALQAAILRVKLPHLAAWTARRRANAARYRELLADLSDVVLPGDVPEHIYNQFVIRAPRRDALREFLREKHGVPTEIYYPVPLHRQVAFQHLGYKEGSLPHAEAAAREVLALPISPGLTPAQQDQVATGLRAFFG